MPRTYCAAILNTSPYPDLLMEFTCIGLNHNKSGFSFSIEPFSYAYFAVGNISVGFTPTRGTVTG
ncbi:hypothetical protein HDF15_000930 [Granulicella mallensis]|uniref:Uncharacterized protein n=1 Tax=Granulicella mallensis TaxID=940614 RepID=A0A7W8E9Q2_9BACT|nr:hypothetical protein [Granulicella mallensis]